MGWGGVGWVSVTEGNALLQRGAPSRCASSRSRLCRSRGGNGPVGWRLALVCQQVVGGYGLCNAIHAGCLF